MGFPGQARVQIAFYALLALSGAAAIDRRQFMLASREKREDPKPVWPTNFLINFTESATLLVVSSTTNGSYYYNYDEKCEVVARDNGFADRYCGTHKPFARTPCVQINYGDERYLSFPEDGECCKCCSASQGCGILTPTWLDAAKYEGAEPVQGISANKWSIQGVQANYFYQVNGSRAPLEINQVPDDDMIFDISTFQENPPSQCQVPPASCTEQCKGACALV